MTARSVLRRVASRGVLLSSCGLLLFAFTASAVAMVQTQDLVALAKKERERRAKIAKPARVLTEDDGKAAAETGAGALTITGPESAAPAAKVEGATAAGKDSLAAQEGAWRTRAESVRKAVEAAEARLRQTESELKAVTADLAPLSAADAQDPMRLQKKEQKIAELNKQMAAEKNAIAEARKALAAFEEEARSNGVPPGWLR